MRVTPELLLSLGAKPQEDGSYELMMHGYSFKFTVHVDKFVNNGLPTYQMNGHCITDLEECFGFIAEDHYLAGQKEAKQQLWEWLGER